MPLFLYESFTSVNRCLTDILASILFTGNISAFGRDVPGYAKVDVLPDVTDSMLGEQTAAKP